MAHQPLSDGCSAIIDAISSHDRILKEVLQYASHISICWLTEMYA